MNKLQNLSNWGDGTVFPLLETFWCVATKFNCNVFFWMFGGIGLRKCDWTPHCVFKTFLTWLNNVFSFSGWIKIWRNRKATWWDDLLAKTQLFHEFVYVCLAATDHLTNLVFCFVNGWKIIFNLAWHFWYFLLINVYRGKCLCLTVREISEFFFLQWIFMFLWNRF